MKRHSIQPYWLALGAIFCLLTFTTQASARSNPGAMNVKFKSLQTTASRGVITVDYKISKSSWKQISNVRMNPRLNVYLSNPSRTKYIYVYSTPITRRKGQIVYPRFNLRNHTTAAFEVVGYSGQHRVTTISLGRKYAKLISTKLHRASAPLQPPANVRPPTQRPPTQRPPSIGAPRRSKHARPRSASTPGLTHALGLPLSSTQPTPPQWLQRAEKPAAQTTD